MMRKGIRIIERILRVDKVAEAAERWGDERALGCLRAELFTMPPVEWQILQPVDEPIR
jgi:hypothetical protein